MRSLFWAQGRLGTEGADPSLALQLLGYCCPLFSQHSQGGRKPESAITWPKGDSGNWAPGSLV